MKETELVIDVENCHLYVYCFLVYASLCRLVLVMLCIHCHINHINQYYSRHVIHYVDSFCNIFVIV